MQMPEILTGESLTRLLQGAGVGAIATMALGFGYGGWMLGGAAKALAETTASSAVVAAVAPICVAQFQSAKGSAENMVELKKISSWQQSSYIDKGGWAVMPGGKAAESGVSQACATMLNNLK